MNHPYHGTGGKEVNTLTPEEKYGIIKSFEQAMRLEAQDSGSFLNSVSIFATQKGMASFKSAATPFFYNSGTISHRKLKFRI